MCSAPAADQRATARHADVGSVPDGLIPNCLQMAKRPLRAAACARPYADRATEDGAFVQVCLPDGTDAADVTVRQRLDDDVISASGKVFSASHGVAGFMRFNVARCSHARIFAVLAQAMDPVVGRPEAHLCLETVA